MWYGSMLSDEGYLITLRKRSWLPYFKVILIFLWLEGQINQDYMHACERLQGPRKLFRSRARGAKMFLSNATTPSKKPLKFGS